MGVVVGVDAGTSVVKSVAYATDGAPVARSARPNEVLAPEPGWREQDMEATWRAVAATLREVVSALDDGTEVLALGVTGQGDGCWLVDDDGTPARNAILWSDGRADGVVEAWRSDGTDRRLYDVCGGVQFPGSSLALLLWLREHEPAALERADTVLFCKDWLKYRLTGTLCSDPSDMTLPYLDVETGEYASEPFEAVGAPALESLLPPLRGPLEVVGEVTTDAADRTGLPAGTPVVSGLFDVPASMFGAGVARPGEGVSVVGTTSLNQVLLDEPITEPRDTGYTLALGLDGRWSRFMASMRGTPNLDWFLETLYPDDADYATLEERASAIPIGSEGVLYLPYLSPSGERAPFLDTDARAGFTGLAPDHTADHLLRAVYEGVALAMRDCYEHLPTVPGTVRVAGGGARSTVWCRMFADCLGTRVAVPAGTEFGAKGAALLAATAVGVYGDLPGAVAATSSLERSFAPARERTERYDRLYDWFRTTYGAMFEVWAERAETLAALDDR